MCMSLELLLSFLNLVGPDIISSEPGQFTVHASQGDVVWVEDSENWCTDGPQIERDNRFDS